MLLSYSLFYALNSFGTTDKECVFYDHACNDVHFAASS